MDAAADATAAALGAWASVRGFFTPATLFLVVNLVIGTIWLTSRTHQRRRRGNGYSTAHDADAQHNHHHQEQPPFHHQQEDQYYDDRQQQHEQQYVPPPPAPAPLARTSSVLDRLRSIGLYRFRSGDFPPEYAAADSRDVAFSPAPSGADAHYESSRSEPAPVMEERRRPAAPSRMRKSSSSEARRAAVPPVPAAKVVQVRAAALEDHDDFVTPHHEAEEEEEHDGFVTPPPAHHEVEEEEEEEEEQYYREEYVPPLRPAPLARAPSVLERLRSFGLYRFRSGDLGADDAGSAVAELERNQAQKQATQYSRSRSEPSKEQTKKKQQQSSGAKMSKSSSEARKPALAPVEPEAEAEGGVDARADDFINSFRKQLQLQRLNSLLNYKDMLNRGA
uniref:Uncharacterized protein n=1 Tax=Avena sativa TaxID=4498 RepID=A0ACD5TEE8_AVESA